MGNKDDSYYMSHAINEIDIIIGYTKGLSYEEIFSDLKTTDAIMFRLTQMVEYIKSISIAFKEFHNEVPWNDIVGFRNKIVHEYGKTDFTTVYEVLSNEIYQLKELFDSNL